MIRYIFGWCYGIRNLICIIIFFLHFFFFILIYLRIQNNTWNERINRKGKLMKETELMKGVLELLLLLAIWYLGMAIIPRLIWSDKICYII